MATAQRVARYRPLIEGVAAEAGFDPDTIEGMVFLESAGRPDAAADPQLEGAVGLTQILAETGRNLLGMRVDPAAARRLGRSIRRNEARGRDAVVQRLRARRRAVDERFDPVASLRATGRYLQIAKRELGRNDLAVVSYHMGIGNLQAVLRDYGRDSVPYAQLFFDVTPLHHPAAYAPAELVRRRLVHLPVAGPRGAGRSCAAGAPTPRPSSASTRGRPRRPRPRRCCIPPGSTPSLRDAGDVEDAIDDGDLVELPGERLRPPAWRSTTRSASSRRGSTASRRCTARCAPRPWRVLEYLGTGRPRDLGRRAARRSRARCATARYQRLLAAGNAEATRGYSLHTTGYAFDIRRDYASRGQARAFQFLLDRLVALDLIAWVREPAAIHVTVSARAGEALVG